MRFRKMLTLLTLSALFLVGASGCSTSLKSQAQNEKLNIICVSFAEYDWTKEILGEHIQDVNLVYLLENGMDLHNYQPSAKDMIQISGCDLFVYTSKIMPPLPAVPRLS